MFYLLLELYNFMFLAVGQMLQLLLLLGIECNKFSHCENLLNILLTDDRVEGQCRVVIHHFLPLHALGFIRVVFFEQLV